MTESIMSIYPYSSSGLVVPVVLFGTNFTTFTCGRLGIQQHLMTKVLSDCTKGRLDIIHVMIM